MASSASETNRARAYCLRLLGRREYGRGRLARKLKEKGYGQDLIEALLTALEEEGLQSDRRCGEAILRSGERRGWSRRRCRERMRQEGLDHEIVKQLDWPDDELERAQAQQLYERWLGEASDRASKQRVLRRLAGRGFPVGHLFD